MAKSTDIGSSSFDWGPGESLVFLGRDGRIYQACDQLTPKILAHGGPKAASGLRYSRSGNQLCFLTAQNEVCMIRLDDPVTVSIVSNTNCLALDPVWSPDGSMLVWHEWDFGKMPWQSGRIVGFDIEHSTRVNIVDAPNHQVGQPLFSPDGTKLSFLSSKNGWLNLWMSFLRDGVVYEIEPLVFGEFEIDIPQWSSGHATYCWSSNYKIHYWRNELGIGSLRQLDLMTGIDAGIASGAWWSLSGNGTNVVGVNSSYLTSCKIQLLTLDSKIGEPITLVDTGRVYGKPHVHSLITTLNICETDSSFPVRGRLIQTDSAGDKPLLMVLHGGPTGQLDDRWDVRVDCLRSNGWDVFLHDYLGSSGWGVKYRDDLNGNWGVSDALSVLSAASYLKKEFDHSSIVLYGASAGGFLVLTLLQNYGEHFAGGIAVSPVSHVTDFETVPWRYQAKYLEDLLGKPSEKYEFWKKRDICLGGKIAGPLLVLHGDRDEIVPFSHSELLHKVQSERYRNDGVSFIQVEGEGHTWNSSTNATSIELNAVLSFLETKVLKSRLVKF